MVASLLLIDIRQWVIVDLGQWIICVQALIQQNLVEDPADNYDCEGYMKDIFLTKCNMKQYLEFYENRYINIFDLLIICLFK